MAAVASNRVVAEFYYGIDFPSDWADKPTTMITAGLAHERVASVIVLLDAGERPLAACWQLDGCDEKFARIDPDGGNQDDLLSELTDDLAYQSRRDTDHGELYATLLWEPNEVPLALGTVVHRILFMQGRYMSEWGWNVATRELVAKAPGLVLVTRRNSTDLALPVPADADACITRWATTTKQLMSCCLHPLHWMANRSQPARSPALPLACTPALRYNACSLTRRTRTSLLDHRRRRAETLCAAGPRHSHVAHTRLRIRGNRTLDLPTCSAVIGNAPGTTGVFS